MGRSKGTFNFAANFEVLAQAPLDARQVVDTYADLTDPSVWQDNDLNVWLFDGLIVAVIDDSSTTLNGIYYLTDAANYTASVSWSRVGVDIDVTGIEASLNYLYQITSVHEASIYSLEQGLLSTDASIVDLRDDLLSTDASIIDLRNNLAITDASLLYLENWNISQDSSIVDLRSRIDVIDTSLIALDTSISYNLLINNVQDASISALDSAFLTLESSIAYNTQVNITQDASIVDLRGRLDVVDISLAYNLGLINTLDASIVRIDLYQAIQDTSISAIETDLSGLESSIAYNFGLIEALDASIVRIDLYQASQDASIVDLRSRIDVLDSSVAYNLEQINQLDASILDIRVELLAVDASLLALSARIDVVDSSLIALESYVDASIVDLQTKLDASIIRIDASIDRIDAYQLIQDASIELALSKDTSVRNVGTGTGIYRDNSEGYINLRSLVGTSTLDVSLAGDQIVIDTSIVFTGEANVGQNIGTGDVSIYAGKEGVVLRIRTLRESRDIKLSYADSSTISVDGSGLINEVSLGSAFYWNNGYLEVDASGLSDASLNQLWAIVGGTYDSSNFIDENDSVTENISELDRVLALLTPTPPDPLSSKNLTNPGSYSARAQSTGSLLSNLTSDTTPTSTVSDFLKTVGPNLIAIVNGSPDGSINITSADMQGSSDGALTITDESDPYDGQSGKEGFWLQLSASITVTSPLDASINAYTYNLQYPDSGNETGAVTFYVDDPQTPSISNQSVDVYPGSVTRYVSGVPSYNTGETITISYTVVDPVGAFYNSSTIGYANLNAGNALSAGLPGAPYITGQDVDVSTQVLTFATGQYYEDGNISTSITPYRSSGSYGSGVGTLDVSGRIDTTSDESPRLLSGSGLYPASGYGGAYDSTQSLKSGSYVNELQKLNNLYRWPTGDYTGWQSGPDYTTGLGSVTRWVTFSTSVTNATSFTIQFSGDNFTADAQQITQDVSIHAKVEGVTGWVNCNYPYPGGGNPSIDGDPCMVLLSSDHDTKVCTFGTTPRTGTLYVRVGISSTSNPRFISLSVS